MILKTFEAGSFDFKKFNIYLLYGENEGFKKDFFEKNILIKADLKITTYDENDILINYESILSSLLNKSLFETEKLIMVNRCTDKILGFVQEIIEKEIDDVKIIFKSSILEKRSKLRLYFEKSKKIICTPFYKDNHKTLSLIISDFFKKKNIPISQEIINILVDRSGGERSSLNNELGKIESYIYEKRKISFDEISVITNLSENYSVSELIDSCLKKNLKKTINILNENNYSSEDCLLIIRTFLIKLKRLLDLKLKTEKGETIDTVINSYKPSIFWKDKEVVKTQIKIWSLTEIHKLLSQINETELKIKKNIESGLLILSDFLITKSKTLNN
ncbi:MAG: DNA polymerase III subunit delta [Candidatus Pelagibacter sp.]|tara:strand:- start:836 stop:1831 length:996 start_codon:yes stop_codon:yes gene_type:complete